MRVGQRAHGDVGAPALGRHRHARQQRDAGAGRTICASVGRLVARNAELLGARAGAHRERLIAQAVAVVEQQHVRAPQVGELAGRGALRQRVAARRGEHEGLAADHLAHRASAEVGLQREQRGVELARVSRATRLSVLSSRSAGQPRVRARTAGTTDGSRYGEIVGMTPMRSEPDERIAEPARGIDQIVGVDQHAARARDQLLARRA